MKYAGFAPRSNAAFVDALLFIPIYVLAYWLFSSKTASLAITVPLALLFPFYQIYFHGRWGQTLGKRAAKIIVVKLNGEAISWKEAFLRNSVDIIFATIWSIGHIAALWAVASSEYDAIAWWRQAHRISELNPLPKWLQHLGEIWFWSELIVLLFNKKKRALHDFIAGTVVIHKEAKPS